MARTAARGAPRADDVAMPAAASAPSCAGPRRPPAATTTSPAPHVAAARADVRARRHRAPQSRLVVMFDNILDGDDGVGALRDDAAGRDPHRLARRERAPAGRPAAIRATTGSVPGVSAARTANPSIAELANGGRSTAARAPARRARGRRPPRAARARAGSGCARASTGASASSIDSSSATTAAYPTARRIGSAAVISVVVPVHNEERSVALLYDELARRARAARPPWEAVFVDDGSTDGTFAALTRLHAAQRQRPRRPPAPQLRQGGRARGRLRAGRGRRHRHDRRRPPGRPGRDPAAARQARRGLRPRLRLEDAAPRPAHAAASRRRSSTGSPAASPGCACTT